jgi:hypothetical protein
MHTGARVLRSESPVNGGSCPAVPASSASEGVLIPLDQLDQLVRPAPRPPVGRALHRVQVVQDLAGAELLIPPKLSRFRVGCTGRAANPP